MISSEKQLQSIEAIRILLEKNPKLQILLVEDNPKDAFLTQTVLESCGVHCIWVDSCAKALHLVQSSDHSFSGWLVFLDLNLETPGAGLILLEKLKTICENCKVVIMTGAYSQDSQECRTALERGALAIMLKPLTQEQAEFLFGKTK